MNKFIISSLTVAILFTIEFLIIQNMDKHYYKNHSRNKPNVLYDISLFAVVFMFMFFNYILLTFLA